MEELVKLSLEAGIVWCGEGGQDAALAHSIHLILPAGGASMGASLQKISEVTYQPRATISQPADTQPIVQSTQMHGLL